MKTQEKKIAVIAKSEEAEESIARSELNLEQNSIFTVSTYKGKSRGVIITEYMPDGSIHKRKAIVGKTITGAETGVLTTQHFKTYLTLVKIWEESGRQVDEPIKFTILNILNLLELADAGPNYEMIKEQLIELRQIPLTFIDSFFTPKDGTYRSLRPFTILNHLEIYERINDYTYDKTRSYGEFQFDKYILESLVDNHVHPLRLDVIRKFKRRRDISILLYTYVDRNLAFKNEYTIGLEKLFEHLGLSQSYIKYPSQRKQKIQPVCNILEGKFLSTGTLSHCRIYKTANGQDYKLVCRKDSFPKKQQYQPAHLKLPIGNKQDESEIPESPEPGSELFPLLIGNSLTEKQAAKLIAEKNPEDIKMQVEYLPYRVKEYKAQKKAINMPAILYDSIADNWNVPKGYIEAGKARGREMKRLEAERIALEERQEWDRAEQERDRIKTYKESLNSNDRTKLREKALEKIRGMNGIKEGFITETLIEIHENEILREEI